MNTVRPKKTILCVDHNEQQLSIRRFLLETKGYNVVACTNANDAMKAFRGVPVDLVLCELMLPEVDGPELIRRLKKESPLTPTILFSDRVKIYDKDMPADAFLPRNLANAHELLERIRLLLIRKRGPKKFAQPHIAAGISAAV